MTMKERRTPAIGRLSGLFMFLLLAMLAILSLISVMLGIRIYNKVVDTTESNAVARTSLSYMATRLSSSDETDCIHFDTIKETDVVILVNVVEDIPYLTYIYFHDGKLKEYTANAGFEFTPGFGSPITELNNLKISLDGDTFTFVADDGAALHEMRYHVRTGVTRGGLS